MQIAIRLSVFIVLTITIIIIVMSFDDDSILGTAGQQISISVVTDQPCTKSGGDRRMQRVYGTTAKLERLRALMKSMADLKYVGSGVGSVLHAYIVPSGDAHQSEYIAECDERRAFISGFTGSTGTAVVTDKQAALWTDGRYFLQAEQQLDSNWILMKEGLPKSQTVGAWLNSVLPNGSRVGVDPFLFSPELWLPLATQLESEGNQLVAVAQNLVDSVWNGDRPQRPNNKVVPQPLKYAGKSWMDKVREVRAAMLEKHADVLVVTALDEIAWLLNMRGSDIMCNPVFFANVIVTTDDVHLFINATQVDAEVRRHLTDASGAVIFHPYEELEPHLRCLIDGVTGKFWISNKSSYALVNMLPRLRLVLDSSPIQLSKAVKNPTEVEGMRQSSIRDAAALCEYFAWLETEVPKGNVTEISGADRLFQFRKEQTDFVGISFPTISSSGLHGAVIHYSPSAETDKAITVHEMYLCDSGGQYWDGTTDVTRTLHFGTPSDYERECFTRVLKGHIALSTAIFPSLIKGQLLDTLARTALWQVGLDYLHGTGHGVGAYLNVHEGPIGIGQRPRLEDPGLRENMIVTDEPGFYEDGKFGCRIENVVIVKKADTKYKFNNVTYLTFEPLTLVPIQTKLVDVALLTTAEIDWLNEYHEKCVKIVGDVLKSQGRLSALEWLIKETKPISLQTVHQ